jgi:uncharacterized protein
MQKSSIIEFSVQNWGPFEQRATFSMAARKKDGHTFVTNGENLLRTSLIYGPNASGKTSILDALYQFKTALNSSANTQEDENEEKLPYNPHLGTDEGVGAPSFLEAVFSIDDSETDGVYKYNFSVLKNKIVEENLIEISKNGTERVLLNRRGQQIEADKNFREIADFLAKQGNLRDDALLMSLFAQLNHKFAVLIVNTFSKRIAVITGISDMAKMDYWEFTLNSFKDNADFRRKTLNLLKKADFCIGDGKVRSVKAKESTGGIKEILTIFFSHPASREGGEKPSTFEIPLMAESQGTRSFFFILGPILDALEWGKILFIDELDNSLHPLLTKFIIELFESEEVNKKNAQLVATTHDVSLLANKNLIKDQFWFTEKDNQGSAKLFSLAEFELRNDTEYAKKYLEGRFGALPLIGLVND